MCKIELLDQEFIAINEYVDELIWGQKLTGYFQWDIYNQFLLKSQGCEFNDISGWLG